MHQLNHKQQSAELSCARHIDTCHVIEFNFGAKPFKFDLEGCEEEADLEMGSRSFAEVLQNALWNPMPERPSRPRPRTSMQAVADVLQHLQLNIEHIEQQQQVYSLGCSHSLRKNQSKYECM